MYIANISTLEREKRNLKSRSYSGEVKNFDSPWNSSSSKQFIITVKFYAAIKQFQLMSLIRFNSRYLIYSIKQLSHKNLGHPLSFFHIREREREREKYSLLFANHDIKATWVANMFVQPEVNKSQDQAEISQR